MLVFLCQRTAFTLEILSEALDVLEHEILACQLEMVWEMQDELVVVQAVSRLDAKDAVGLCSLCPVEIPFSILAGRCFDPSALLEVVGEAVFVEVCCELHFGSHSPQRAEGSLRRTRCGERDAVQLRNEWFTRTLRRSSILDERLRQPAGVMEAARGQSVLLCLVLVMCLFGNGNLFLRKKGGKQTKNKARPQELEDGCGLLQLLMMLTAVLVTNTA